MGHLQTHTIAVGMVEVDKLTCRLSSGVVTRMEETSVVGAVFDINMPIAWLNHILRSDAAFGVSDPVLNVLGRSRH